MVKIFPCNHLKRPLLAGWQEKASADPQQIKCWHEEFGQKLAYWGIPTGPVNDLLVLDIDVKDANGFETLRNHGINLPVTRSQRTRSGGAHLFFEYPKDGRYYGCRVGFLPGLDIRGSGGYVCYYNVPDDTPLVEAPDWLLRNIGRDPDAFKGETVGVAPEIAREIMLNALTAIREAPAGESNNILNGESFKVGQLVACGAVSREHAENSLFEAAKDRGKPDYEARATIASGLDGGMKKPLTSPFTGDATPAINIPAMPAQAERWTPSKITIEDLLNTSKLRKPQLFEDWSTEDIQITTADGGTGKTTLKLYEAICLALGVSFLGFTCKQAGRTLFITGEDDEAKLKAMLGAILRAMGLFKEGEENRRKLSIIVESILIKKDADLCLIAKDKQGFLHPNGLAMTKIMEAIEDFKPKMIVFDPIASFWGSEAALNDMNKAVTKFMSSLVQNTNCCVEMINHMGKQSSALKDMSQFAGRGGSGLPSNSRVSRVLRGIDEKEYQNLTGEELPQNTSVMMCVVNKFTDGSPLYNKPFLIIREGYLFSRKSISKNVEREMESNQTSIQRVFQYVKEAKDKGQELNTDMIEAHFHFQTNQLSKAKIRYALGILMTEGYMGEKLKMTQSKDMTAKKKIFIIVDHKDHEI